MTITTTHTIPTYTIPSVTTKSRLGEAFKPKRAGTKSAHIVFLLDDSGSMQTCRKSTIEGFNEYVKSQKIHSVETGIPTFASLYKFDGRSVTCVYDRKDIANTPLLSEETYNPQGWTNLYDGIGGVMMQVNTALAQHKKADRDSIIINILTDGQENSSRTFSNFDIKIMVEKAEGKNWGFMFLGANIDAFAVGSTMGFSAQNTMQYDTSNMLNTMKTVARRSNDMKTAYASGLGTSAVYASTAFTEEELTSVRDKK